MTLQSLQQQLSQQFDGNQLESFMAFDELTLVIDKDNLLALMTILSEPPYEFNQLIDIAGVDYLHYGLAEWETVSVTNQGFSRAVNGLTQREISLDTARFGCVYHLLSLSLNLRIRIKLFVEQSQPTVPSLVVFFPVADWFEREVYDLFGILFTGHPDLRRILTDYGFVGHPFRKDFPLSGEVEMRYDAKRQAVIYEPVSIEPRIGVPKVIREDNRYMNNGQGKHEGN